MTEMHTFNNYKKETYYPQYMNRKQYQAWSLEGEKDIKAVLNEKVRKIIEADQKVLLTDEVLQKYAEIIERRETELSEGKHHKEDF